MAKVSALDYKGIALLVGTGLYRNAPSKILPWDSWTRKRLICQVP